MFTEESYPHFFRIVQSENEYNPPRLSLLKYFNWTRVGTLYQNLAKYTLVIVALTNSTLSIGLSMFCLPQAHNNLISELVKNKFEVVESQSFNDEIECEDNLVGADRKNKRFDINLSLSSIRRDTQNSQTSKLVSSP